MKTSHSYSLNDYVIRRNGRPLGASGSLTTMLRRSFTAPSPRIFWQYWNPIFGYYLGKYVFTNFRKILPSSLSIIFTFIVSGLIHDLVTIAVNGYTSFFFSLFFLLLSMVVILGEFASFNLSKYSKAVRITFNLFYLISSFCITYYLIYLF